VTYLITFACYGCRLHGDATGSVDRWHNAPGGPVVDEHLARAAFEEGRMDQPPYYLDSTSRDVVLQAIQGVCAHRGWNLLAVHVRSTHVHTVVDAEVPPERIMNHFKAYASRHLNRMGLEEPGPKRWARHGSTRWLWKPHHVSAAIQYVVAEQGDAMSVFEAQES
jgi:REP element-mobilizing transposase RayT